MQPAAIQRPRATLPALSGGRGRLVRAALAFPLLLVSLSACASFGMGRAERIEQRMQRAIQDSVSQVVRQAVADSAFPGAYAVVGSRDRVYFSGGFGVIDWLPGSPAPDERTLWDLASLTKVIGMTTGMMQLVSRGAVDLDAPVSRYLPRFTGPGKDAVTVRHLLTHSSGLPPWRPLYKESETPLEAVAAVYATELDTVPGARMAYSDLGAILLGQIVEQLSGWPLDQYLALHVFGPLGMLETGFTPRTSVSWRTAPTEYDPWRQRHVRAEVHDENAFRLGGVSAHAGLFSTGHDLTIFSQMLLGGGARAGVRIVPEATIRAFTHVQDSSLSHRALGWETPSGSNSAGRLLSRPAFGHTGFTGTSMWMDPTRDLFVILLTNRVNPTRQNARIGRVRSALADAVVSAADAASGRTPSTTLSSASTR
ncbi:MAG TPA: serine hydrolase domain-containing protein [Gemmatimonadaceae bacterium]|nr:serine hydrolase domain-containing protein [Gemmatimonadaceae bacterium]